MLSRNQTGGVPSSKLTVPERPRARKVLARSSSIAATDRRNQNNKLHSRHLGVKFFMHLFTSRGVPAFGNCRSMLIISIAIICPSRFFMHNICYSSGKLAKVWRFCPNTTNILLKKWLGLVSVIIMPSTFDRGCAMELLK